MMARSKIAPRQRSDTLLQLSRSSVLEVRLVPRGRAIHLGTLRQRFASAFRVLRKHEDDRLPPPPSRLTRAEIDSLINV
jgi:hypothetical protein